MMIQWCQIIYWLCVEAWYVLSWWFKAYKYFIKSCVRSKIIDYILKVYLGRFCYRKKLRYSHRRFEVTGDREISEKSLWKSSLEVQLDHSFMGMYLRAVYNFSRVIYLCLLWSHSFWRWCEWYFSSRGTQIWILKRKSIFILISFFLPPYPPLLEV